MSVNLTVRRGEKLRLLLGDFPGGMRKAVVIIHNSAGPLVGNRATFSKLYDMEDASDLDATDRVRLWLLLTVIGEEPSEWGLGDDDIPPLYREDRFQEAVREAGYVSVTGENLVGSLAA